MYVASEQTGPASIMVAQGDRILAAADNCKAAPSKSRDTNIAVGLCDKGASIQMNPATGELTIFDVERGSVTIKDTSYAQ